jgi:hypothetical protein
MHGVFVFIEKLKISNESALAGKTVFLETLMCKGKA